MKASVVFKIVAVGLGCYVVYLIYKGFTGDTSNPISSWTSYMASGVENTVTKITEDVINPAAVFGAPIAAAGIIGGGPGAIAVAAAGIAGYEYGSWLWTETAAGKTGPITDWFEENVFYPIGSTVYWITHPTAAAQWKDYFAQNKAGIFDWLHSL